MTHAELMARLSVREFTEWVAFYAYEAKEQEKALKKSSAVGADSDRPLPTMGKPRKDGS